MERLTRPDVDVTEYADKFLNTRLKGKEIDWKRTNDAGIDLLINAITCDEFSKDVFRQMARDLYGRLKQFEDAVQTPENFYKMYGEFCLLESALKNYGSHARMKELAEADKDGRVVVLPCKVGDTVWITGSVRRLYSEKVRTFFCGDPSYGRGEADNNVQMIRTTGCDIPIHKFNKTVFLTREEAEAALEAMKNG